MKKTFDFLRALACHNDREWFKANKQTYLDAQAEFYAMASELILAIKAFDRSIGSTRPQDYTYRIYRDVRFSKDKSPYKTHFSLFVAREGKKSGYSGYYLQISGSGEHLIAVGDYMVLPQVLKTLREDIEMRRDEFLSALDTADRRFELDRELMLKKVPKGFPEDNPESEYYRLKRFCLIYAPDDQFFHAPELVPRLAEILQTGKPFLDFINRAIELHKEGE